MKAILKTIIGSIILILILIHLTIIGLLTCPASKLMNIVLAQDVKYVALSDIPEHVRHVFSTDDRLIDLPKNDNPIRQISSKILNFRKNKVFNDDEHYELYLNTLDFGGNVIGIEAASNYYFQKSISDLSFEESLTLVNLYKIFK